MRNVTYSILFSLLALAFCCPAMAEVQNSLTISAPTLYPGDSGSFTASSTSGPAASAIGTKTFTYSGQLKYGMGLGDGRFTGSAGLSRYGVGFDAFEILQSFVSPLFHTLLTSGSSCPSTTTYNWIGVRFRNVNLTRGSQDPTATNFYAGGTLVYNAVAAHPLTGSSYFDLAGPTSYAASYSMDANGGGCASGTFKTVNNSGGLSPTPFDAYGSIFFGANSFSYLSSSGNPLVMVGFANQTVNAATFSGINAHVFSGIYTSFDWPGSQTRQNIYMVPNAAGTTFALRAATSDSDPTQYTTFGSLACTSIGSPSAGFCSGTLTLQGVSGSGKAVCALSTTGQPTIACAAQRPDYNQAPVSIIASVPSRAVLSVAVSPTVAQTANTSSTATITATLTNLSGRAITSLANPGGGLDLVAPFSNTGAYAGTGGTCTSSLAGYASCNVTITYSPSAIGTHLQTFRVAYNNGSGTTNATASLVGTAGLSSISINNPRPGYAPNSTQTFTVKATYSDGSTQDVSSAVAWTSSNTSAATIASGGVANFFQVGSSTLTASLGTSTASVASVVLDPTTYFGVLGQTSTTSVHAAANGGVSAPYGVTATGTKLFVSDFGNHRVAVFNTLPTATAQPASFTLCQGAIDSVWANQGGIAANRCFEPTGVSTDGTRLIVGDARNNRALLWTTLPTAQGQSPTYVLGQPNFTTVNYGVTASQFGGYAPDVFVGSSKVLVSDTTNQRVLIWSAIPTTSTQPASLVLGQVDMTSSGSGLTNAKFNNPRGIYTNGTKLYIADQSNHRVLVWNTFPTVNGQAASAVLGQADFVSGSANRGTGAPTASTLSGPQGVWGDGTKLYVSDSDNNRVLVWNTYPSTTGKAADFAIGQTTMTDLVYGAGMSLMQSPTSATALSGRLFVADLNISRVMVWNTLPSVTGTAADLILGQGSADNGFWQNDESATVPDSQRISNPQHLHSDGQRLTVADTSNHRVLIWNTFPTSTYQAANIVLGQPSFTTNAIATTASGMNFPGSTFTTGSKLIVSDRYNSRVLIWNSMPTVNGQPASLVLGQPDFTTANWAVGASALANPWGIWSDGTKLLVADANNNRVLIWNTFPTVNAQPASLVIGQPDMTSSGSGTSATTMSQPSRPMVAGNRLFVSDFNNHRILAWNSFPTVNGQAADYVLLEPNLTTGYSGASASSFLFPGDVFFDGVRLLASGHSRVVIWNTVPTVSNQPFSQIIGQISANTQYYNQGSSGSDTNPSGTAVTWPMGVWSDGVYTFAADQGNGRILKLAPSSSPYANLSISGGPTYSFTGGNVGESQTAPAFTVSNSGGQMAYDLGVNTALTAPFYYKGGSYPGTGGTCGTTLAGGASCTLYVTYLPTVAGTWSGTALSLRYHNGDGGAYQTTSINLAASVSTSNLTISDGPTYNFGTVATSATKTFTVTNPGGTKATLMWSGTAPAAPYSFLGGTYPGTGGTCTTQLGGGATCTIVISMNPTTTGTFPATVSIVYTDAGSVQRTLSVAVTGTK